MLPGGKAIRYGAIVGEDGQAWSGVATVGRKEEWPGWTPTEGEKRRLGPVLVGNSCSDILVVQAAQDGHGECLTDGLDGARNRRVLLQRQMRAGLVVIFLI